jgi:Protein of unknown function (DUF2950)
MFRLYFTHRREGVCPVSVHFVSLMLLLFLNGIMVAQQPGPRSFASPEGASKALFAAALADDQAAMLDIFGPQGNEITSTGDVLEDTNTRDQFVAKYREMHRIVEEQNGSLTIYIGAENWPFPVPLVSANGVWHFDAEAGEKEILYRRVGENEFGAMNVCHALVDAEKEYYSRRWDGRVQQYAQVLVSDEGQHNGLFWKTSDGEPESPIGSLVAYAEGGGDGRAQEYENSPFHGYYYRILSGRAVAPPGGDKSYIVNGNMTGGFAIVAYPAEYRSSGVMTFIVNQTGVIYQKDLGDETVEVASAMTAYAPDETWKEAE